MNKEELEWKKRQIFEAKFGGKLFKMIDYLTATYEERKIIKKLWDNKQMFDAGFDAAVEILFKHEKE